MSDSHNHEKTYGLILGGLLVLTVVTVVVSYFDFGIFNIVVAMGIATVKATLVGLFFMHLYYDEKFNQVAFASSFVFLAIFVGLTGADLFLRDPVTSDRFQKASVFVKRTHDRHDYSHSSAELVDLGKRLYKVHCASHIPEGFQFPEGSDKIFKLLSHGNDEIPSFSDLGEKERWAIAHYLFSK